MGWAARAVDAVLRAGVRGGSEASVEARVADLREVERLDGRARGAKRRRAHARRRLPRAARRALGRDGGGVGGAANKLERLRGAVERLVGGDLLEDWNERGKERVALAAHQAVLAAQLGAAGDVLQAGEQEAGEQVRWVGEGGWVGRAGEGG